MGGRRSWRERLLMAGVVLHPAVTVALAAGGSGLRADGPASWGALAWVLAALAVVSFLASVFLPGRLVVLVLAALATAVSVYAVTTHVQHRVLRERGVTDLCVPTEIRQQVTTSRDADGHETRSVRYVHRLRCRDHGSTVADWPRAEGVIARPLAVTFDPDARVPAVPTARVPATDRWWVPTAVIAWGVATALRVLGLTRWGRAG